MRNALLGLFLCVCIGCSANIPNSITLEQSQCPEINYPHELIDLVYNYEEEVRRTYELETFGCIVSGPINKSYIRIVSCVSLDDKCFGIYLYDVPESLYAPEGDVVSCGEHTFMSLRSHEKPFFMIDNGLLEYCTEKWIDEETGNKIENISNFVYAEGSLSEEEMRVISENYYNTPFKCT